jgi:phosphoribosyl-AMP cyclohydrolase
LKCGVENSMINVIRFDADGLVPAVVQDVNTRQVLMLAFMNAASLQATAESGLATFWSRRRRRLWRKGETSGNLQHVREIRYDCDGDALLLLVEPLGPTCHTGEVSCFYRNLSVGVSA